ncbi:tetratricopeptide repeat protein [Falsiroseomonas sp. HC035]|uniref:tetratricopeptide repeat protein n=1 Tax=Falsiroseomonas sp. HC035 TaxID=3390999 RepID=UPI003D311BE7
MHLTRAVLLWALLLAGALALPGAARAQMETREGIALQNQILQLRQEIEILRRGGATTLPPPSSGGSSLGGRPPVAGVAPQGELVGALLDRVARLEEDLRILRGRAEEAEFRQRSLQERLEKLEGDIDFRLRQIEGQRQGSAAPTGPATAAAPPAARPATPPATTPAQSTPAQSTPAPAAVARPPQRALAEGQAALDRRNFAAAEAAAREVLASRETARHGDAQILLGGALAGRRDFAGAAVAYDDAFRRAPRGSRAPEAMLGVANALIGLNNNRDACAQLADLRGRFPDLRGPVAERVADARRRAQCR